MIPKPIQQSIFDHLSLKITRFSFSSGGCINEGGKLVTDCGDYFLKWNDAYRFPGMFKAEKLGFELLRGTKTLHLPKVILVAHSESWQYILMEFIEGSIRSTTYWQDLGKQLAALHKHSNPHFGLDHNNYIGSLPQVNGKTISWIEFFTEHRLGPQLKKLREGNRIDLEFVKSLETLYPRMSEIMPDEAPSLLHGDLWSGNVMVGPEGVPYVIDPAIYYGHREAEIAFTKLFGGFDESFYDAYNHHYPLVPGFEERIELYNLYPLLVHANLFGDSYLNSIRSIIKSFS